MNNVLWPQDEFEVACAAKPYLRLREIAGVLNAVFDNGRERKGIDSMLRRHGVKIPFIGVDRNRAADAVRELGVSGRIDNPLAEAAANYIRGGAFKSTETAESKGKAEYSESGNSAYAESKGADNVRTLEDLLRVCDVNLDVWAVDHHVVNKWEVAAKGDDHRLHHAPLYQVKAWLVRRKPVKCEWPAIHPVKVSAPKVSKGRVPKRNTRIAVVLPDIQMGFSRDMRTGHLNPLHDRGALDIAWQICRHIRPDVIVQGGDFFDFTRLGKYRTSPEFYFTLQPAIDEGHWHLRRLRACCNEMVIVGGNHDQRLPNWIADNVIEAYGIRKANQPDDPPALSLESLLCLPDLGIQYIGDYPNGRYWLNDNLACEHGEIARKDSGATVTAYAKRLRYSKIVSHIHRVEMATITTDPRAGLREYTVCSFGTLCRLDGVVPGVKARQNWQQGMGVVHYQPGNGFFDIHPVRIYRDRCIYDGREWTAEDHTQEIADATGWEAML